MNKKTTLSISAIALASILLMSGFGLSSASAQTNSKASIKATLPTNIDNKYSVIFQVCAGDTAMRAPEVVISSDSAVKSVKLNKGISANSCHTTGTTIDALDEKTIKIKKIDKKRLNLMIASAEKKLSQIKAEISVTNDELQKIVLPGNTPLAQETKTKLNEISGKLVELRKELKDTRSEYYRLLYVLRG